MNKVAIVSAGAWGTSIGKVVAENGHEVMMWDFMDSVVSEINEERRNTRYLRGVKLPENLSATTDLESAVNGKDFVIVTTPSLYFIDVVRRLVKVPDIAEGNTVIGVLTKGFIETSRGPQLILQAMEDYLPGFYTGNLVYISGPSHAEEVSRGKLTGLISASLNGKNSILYRELLSSNTLMVFSSLDVVGVQTSAAVKNVVAIAFGILDALMDIYPIFGDNTESLLLAAGLNEIMTLGTDLGSQHPQTFTSIAGVGDLDVTCRSKFGRNRRFGREIVIDRILDRYENIDDLIHHIQDIGYLPEGAVAARHVKRLIDERKLKMPIASSVYRILNREVDPFNSLKQLLGSLSTGFSGSNFGTKP